MPVSMRELLEAGVHFGHQTRRWNPKMRRFIFGERGGIYIIDLQKTLESLEEAESFVRNLAERGGTVLFVGTKKQAQDAIEEEAKRVGMPYVNHRWLGGLLTNWRTISERIEHLHELRRLRDEGQLDAAPAQGAHLDAGRARKARGKPRRRRRHAQAARRDLHRRPAQGAAGRERGAPPRDAGDRARRHELRPGRGRLRHPRQRRRDSLLQPRSSTRWPTAIDGRASQARQARRLRARAGRGDPARARGGGARPRHSLAGAEAEPAPEPQAEAEPVPDPDGPVRGGS